MSLTAATRAFTPEGIVSAASKLTLSHGMGAIFGGGLAGEAALADQLPLTPTPFSIPEAGPFQPFQGVTGLKLGAPRNHRTAIPV